MPYVTVDNLTVEQMQQLVEFVDLFFPKASSTTHHDPPAFGPDPHKQDDVMRYTNAMEFLVSEVGHFAKDCAEVGYISDDKKELAAGFASHLEELADGTVERVTPPDNDQV